MEWKDFLMNTSPGDQTITVDADVGKDEFPFVAMFVMTGAALAPNQGVANAKHSIGFFDGTSSGVLAVQDQSGVGTTNRDTRGAVDECIMVLDTNGTVLAEASGVEFVPNGVKINIGATDGTSWGGYVILFFDKDGAAAAGAFASHATEDETVTVTPNVATDVLITLSPHAIGDNFNDAVDGIFGGGSVGWAVKSGNQGGVRWFSATGAATSDIRQYVSNAWGSVLSTDGLGIEYDNFTATQFDATTRGGTGGGIIGYLALSMPNAQIYAGILDTPTSTGDEPYTDPGFPVKSLLLAPTLVETLNSTITTEDAESFGVGAMTPDGAIHGGVFAADAAGTSNTQSRYLSHVEAKAAGADQLVAATTMAEHANGFTLTYSAVEAAAKKWLYLAMG
jgi:hypothetical protein